MVAMVSIGWLVEEVIGLLGRMGIGIWRLIEHYDAEIMKDDLEMVDDEQLRKDFVGISDDRRWISSIDELDTEIANDEYAFSDQIGWAMKVADR